jgi:hypothetical protein
MTSLEDLLWLYKMALDFDLQDEKSWLKVEIEERLAHVKAPITSVSPELLTSYFNDRTQEPSSEAA